jgi:hypothetical protein
MVNLVKLGRSRKIALRFLAIDGRPGTGDAARHALRLSLSLSRSLTLSLSLARSLALSRGR